MKYVIPKNITESVRVALERPARRRRLGKRLQVPGAWSDRVWVRVGYQSGPLAVTSEDPRHAWVITHIPSGLRFGYLPSIQAGRRACALLRNGSVEWLARGEELRVNQAAGALARAAVREAGGVLTHVEWLAAPWCQSLRAPKVRKAKEARRA